MTKPQKAYVYVLQFENDFCIKIGRTKDLKKRTSQLRYQFKTEFDFKNSYSVECADISTARHFEQELLNLTRGFVVHSKIRDKYENFKGDSELRDDSILYLLRKILACESSINRGVQRCSYFHKANSAKKF